MTISIRGIDKAEVLAALYNASRQQGMGFMHARGASSMTVEEAGRRSKPARACTSTICTAA
jgi:hypothetical protein